MEGPKRIKFFWGLFIYFIFVVSLNGYAQVKSGHSNNTFYNVVGDNGNMALGNPSHASLNPDSANNFLVVKPQYCLSYNNQKHIPNWTSWHLSAKDLGSNLVKVKRGNNFRPDHSLPLVFYRVNPSDYKNSGFDKGHMCPSGDRKYSRADNSATFLMSNMIPQAPNNNRKTWESLESYCRSLVNKGNELYIISGPYGKGGVGSKGYCDEIGNGVVVPGETWKIIVVLPEGDNDIKRINANTRVIAVIIPNAQTCTQKSWDQYRVSVDRIETLTGYDFLSNVSKFIQKKIEGKVDTVLIK